MGTRSTIEEPDCPRKQSILVAMKTLIVGKEPVTVPSLLGTYYINLKSSELVKKSPQNNKYNKNAASRELRLRHREQDP